MHAESQSNGAAKHAAVAWSIDDHRPNPDKECGPCMKPRPAVADSLFCGQCGGRLVGEKTKKRDKGVRSAFAEYPQLLEQALIGAAAHEEAANRAVAYVWQGIVTPGNVVLVAGAPGDGKSTLLSLLFEARRAPRPVHILGREVTPAPADTWLVKIQEEHGEVSETRKQREARQMLGLSASDKVITLARKDCVIGSALWKEVATLVGRGLIDSIWVDSLARFSRGGGDSNSEDDQVAVFSELQRVIESSPADARPSLWATAHTKKGAQGQSTEDVSGSTQRAAQADVVILCRAEREGGGGRVVGARASFIKIREDDGEWPEPCDFVIAKGSDGKKRVTWKVAAPAMPLAERIVEMLRSGARTKNELRKALGRNADAIHVAVTELFREKRIRVNARLVGGRKREAYVLVGGSFEDVVNPPPSKEAP